MSNKHFIYTSEVIPHLKRYAIERDFDIFSISLPKDAETRKHIGGHVLDLLDKNFYARSVLYQYGEQMLCLYNKNQISEDELKKEVEQKLTPLAEVKKLNINNVYDGQLAQLLCNSLQNHDEDNYYNNLSGKMLILKGDSFKYKSSIITYEFEIKTFKKHKSNCNLSINVKTFNVLEDVLKYHPKPQEKEEINKKTRYIRDENGVFRRKLKSDDYSDNKVYVNYKLVEGKRNHEPFLDFDSYPKFLNSKMGVLHRILNDINEDLNEYLSFEFIKVTEFTKENDFSENLVYKNEKEYFKTIQQTGVCIVNMLDDQYDALQVIEQIKQQFIHYINVDDKKIIVQKKPNKDMFNLVLIHTKEYYLKNKLDDPHLQTKEYQHIALEEYISIDKNGNKCYSVTKEVIRKIIYEFFVKQDVLNQQISLFNWNSQGFSNDINYVNIKKLKQEKDECGNKKPEEYEFKILTVKPDGSTTYRKVTKDNNVQEYFDLKSHIDNYKQVYFRYYDVEMIIYDKDSTVLLIDNGLYTLPDLDDISAKLNAYSTDNTVSKLELLNMLKDYRENKPKYKDKINEVIEMIDSSDKTVYTYEEVTNAQYRETAIRPLLRLQGDMPYDFVEYVWQKYRVLFNPMFKNQITANTMVNAVTKITTFKHPIEKIDQATYYFVGLKKSIKDYKLSTATHIRKLQPTGKNLAKEKELICKILTQLNVDFVRLGEFTVYPFPVKYLNEYVKLNNDNNDLDIE